MKKKLRFLTVCLIAAATNLAAAETNIIYLPVNWTVHVGGSDVSTLHQEIEAAKDKPECRPAEFDPEGHWGEIVSGLQMSIRLDTNTFTIGSPINARVILRNTTTNSIAITAPSALAIRLVATDENNNILQPHYHLTVSGPSKATLPSYRQVSYEFNLSEIFNLKSLGTYRVHAERQIELDNAVRLSSDNMIFRIMASGDQK